MLDTHHTLHNTPLNVLTGWSPGVGPILLLFAVAHCLLYAVLAGLAFAPKAAVQNVYLLFSLPAVVVARVFLLAEPGTHWSRTPLHLLEVAQVLGLVALVVLGVREQSRFY
tara:strand:- start:287 stop:619 length:333 start_codon:yes stop_codon:yes gene_type:complete